MAARDFFVPNGLRTRGTIIVVPGRGETPAVYARLGSRLAYDGYREGLGRQVVPLGSDLGAAGITALLADVVPGAVWWPQAAVLAGLPGYRARHGGGWEDELNIRTHCPAHRGVLADATAVQPGRLEALRDDLTPAITVETSAW
jgi:hypothetical protein